MSLQRRRFYLSHKNNLRFGIMLKVNTIYPSFMGEVNCHGIGAPCTFIRLSGCNLRCYHKTKGILCDTPEALEFSSGTDMDESEILSRVSKFGKNIICLTGGEPLLQNISLLLSMLVSSKYYVVIETNGSRPIYAYKYFKNVSFVIDAKTSSSGEASKMLKQNYLLMGKNDVVKFVVDSEEEFNEVLEWTYEYPEFNGTIAVGLFWGSKMSYSDLFRKLNDVPHKIYVNMQAHKLACIYDNAKCNDGLNIEIPKNL